MMPINLIPRKPTQGKKRRVFSAIWRQKSKSKNCPQLPRLNGQRAIVTGGAAGVGEFVTRELLARGAEVTTMARGLTNGVGSIDGANAIQLDLADPATIVAAVNKLGNEKIDLVICNAGLVAKKAETSVTGVEKTFAVNVLGHHILIRLLIERDLLAKNARIVMTTGDIYILESDCSPDIPFDNTQSTYSRSKLGNLWQVAELTARYPNLLSIAVHPGVVASSFAGAKTGFFGNLRSHFLVSEEQGAQSSLIGATQDLPRGAYWHNVFGLVDFEPNDPAVDSASANRLWDQLEALSAPFLL